MQLVDTHIGNVIDGMLTVEFVGEGNELVSVRLATDGNLDGDAAVRRAKEIMTQLAAFDLADGIASAGAVAADPLAEAHPSPSSV